MDVKKEAELTAENGTKAKTSVKPKSRKNRRRSSKDAKSAEKISELMAEIQSQINRNIKLVFNQDDYGIHYKETPFSTEPNGAIFFDSTNGVPIKKGIEKTITSAKIEIGI